MSLLPHGRLKENLPRLRIELWNARLSAPLPCFRLCRRKAASDQSEDDEYCGGPHGNKCSETMSAHDTLGGQNPVMGSFLAITGLIISDPNKGSVPPSPATSRHFAKYIIASEFRAA